MKYEKPFPIQGDHGTSAIDGHWERPAGSVPWGVAQEAYKVYAQWYGTSQSLERLAERGGFGWSELIWLLRGAATSEAMDCPMIDYAEPR